VLLPQPLLTHATTAGGSEAHALGRHTEPHTMRAVVLAFVALLALVAAAGVSGANVRIARAVVRSGDARFPDVLANVTFTQEDDDTKNVTISVDVIGLPVGEYGFHVHEFGDVSSGFPMTLIAGGHFNPLGAPHGCFPMNRHVGDIGSLVITDATVPTHIEFERDLLQLGGASNQSIIGRALLIHAMVDNCMGASGNAGDRIAQGVIGIGQPATGDANVAKTVDVRAKFLGLATLFPTADYGTATLKGSVAFAPLANGNMRVLAKFSGFPNVRANHSFHVHAYGDLFSSNGLSAGGHYDPATTNHHDVYPNTPRHMGDAVAMFTTDENGEAEIDVERDLLSLSAGTGNIVGRGVVVHQLIDQGANVPNNQSGAAGTRWMVGVVGISNQTLPDSFDSSSSTGDSSSSSSGDDGSSSSTGVGAASSVQPMTALFFAAIAALMALANKQ